MYHVAPPFQFHVNGIKESSVFIASEDYNVYVKEEDIA